MSRIRKLYFYDKNKLKEMISFLNIGCDCSYADDIIFNPFVPLHHLVPLNFKFLPESYVIEENNEIKGLITVEPTSAPTKQMEIQKLFFEANYYYYAGELIQYVVSKYKAKGTASFIVRVNDYMPELVKLFISKCGFSQISYEKLWKVKNNQIMHFNKNHFRDFRNSDSQTISSIYNESLLPHIRPLLSSESRDFKENIFKGLSYFSEYKYVLEDETTNNIAAYLSIQTSDNKNYILDIVNPSWIQINVDEILAFVHSKIRTRCKNFNLFVKTKKYTHCGEQYEKLFFEKNYECVSNRIVLTNSSAKIIHEQEHIKSFTILDKIYGGIVHVPGTISGKVLLKK